MRPTIRDVARLAGVSTATVSATLSGKSFVSEALRTQVTVAIAQLGYAPDLMARSLKGGASRLLGLVIPDITNPYYTELVHHLQERARAAGHSVLLFVTDDDPERERAALEQLRSYRAAGVILCPAAAADSYDAGSFAPVGAMVMVDSAPGSLPFDTVSIDNQDAGRIACVHILELGHVHVGAIVGPQHLLTGSDRLLGFSSAFEAAGWPLDPALVCATDFATESGYRSGCSLLQRDRRPTALFVANNTLLIGVMRAITSCGLSCPEDISVLAVDDFDWATAFRPRLTTIRQPVEAMAHAAFTLLQRRLLAPDAAPEHQVFPVELVSRESCAMNRSR